MVGSIYLSGAAQGVEYSIRREQHAVLRTHTGILEAIRDGDAELAESTMRTHTDEYKAHAERKYPEADGRS